jgi:hypothetical protein
VPSSGPDHVFFSIRSVSARTGEYPASRYGCSKPLHWTLSSQRGAFATSLIAVW